MGHDEVSNRLRESSTVNPPMFSQQVADRLLRSSVTIPLTPVSASISRMLALHLQVVPRASTPGRNPVVEVARTPEKNPKGLPVGKPRAPRHPAIAIRRTSSKLRPDCWTTCVFRLVEN